MGMKPTTLGIGLGAAAVGAVAALAISDIVAPKYGIILRAQEGVDISAAKWAKIHDVLTSPTPTPPPPHADSREMLYRVRYFQNKIPQGSPPGAEGDEGKLPEAQLLIDRQEIIDRLPAGFTGHAFQIGLGSKESSKSIPKQEPSMPQAHVRLNMKESKKMVKEVNDVLDGP